MQHVIVHSLLEYQHHKGVFHGVNHSFSTATHVADDRGLNDQRSILSHLTKLVKLSENMF